MRRSSTCALVAVLLLGACGPSDSNPNSPTDQATAAGGQGGHGHGRRFHRLEILLLPPCDTTISDTTGTPGDTTGTPGDTTGTPGDTTGTPGDTTGTPGDTNGIPTLRSHLGDVLHPMGGSGHGSDGSQDSHGRNRRSHRACFGDNSSSRHGSHWFDGWRRWFNNHSTFGLIKIPVPADSDTTVSLRTKLHLVTPNTVYLVQYAVDTIPDRACSDSSWVTVGPGAALESILSDSNGNARQTLTEDVPALPPSFSIDVRFRVVDSATAGIALVSRCHRFTTRS